ncbi:ABC transporter substrate-binding protein [Actinomadura kijaniata]|uniref:Probable sugar-binding periplasmic protein n=1 Tax=Actinomadura namibiensis TaxID=182080 RepID=A0A7W3QMK4_ACTNM|nr:ABC transporter substrate-binding protein [Actinomadura namibiensis]MBA8952108.1 glucose/mannose transport system substrate-binding protein [Actinomadura namibiensis]
MLGRATGRRAVAAVAAVLLGGTLGLTACGGGDDGGGKGGGDASRVEVFSWWTGPGEADGLAAMIEEFKRRNPGTQVVNAAIAGGSGTQAQAVLASRLQNRKPPDSFQGHAGAELLDYIKAGQIEPLDSFYDENNLRSSYPQQLLQQITYQGRIYSVPVNIHRSNILWYNPRILKDAGLSGPPKTIAEFKTALKTVKDRTGKVPLSLGAQWTADHLLENVLLGVLGADAYNALWKPGADWSSPAVTAALNDFAEIMKYTTAEAASTDWQGASKAVVDGKAAFNIMGDWAYGYYVNPAPNGLGKKVDADFGYAPAPGTGGTYMWLSDSFTLPKGAPHRGGALAWLKVAASKEGQDLFNPKKGSIPARKDADRSLYKGYLEYAFNEWNKPGVKLAGSFWHGVYASKRWHTDIDTAVGLFLQGKDVGKLQSALVNAAKNNAQ